MMMKIYDGIITSFIQVIYIRLSKQTNKHKNNNVKKKKDL